MIARRSIEVLFAGLMFASSSAGAQQGTVTGSVRSVGGDAVGGATISVVGTQRGTLARSDGSYSLPLPAGQHVLRARLLGYTVGTDTVAVTEGQTVTATSR